MRTVLVSMVLRKQFQVRSHIVVDEMPLRLDQGLHQPLHTLSMRAKSSPTPILSIKLQNFPYHRHLSMISHIPHPMTPHDLPILKQKLATDL